MNDPSPSDRYNLQRFVDAQRHSLDDVRAELTAGQKRSHWMWFIFPQLRGLGTSHMAMQYAISGRDEARAYLAHPVLGPRLLECTRLVNAIEGRTLRQIFYTPDDLKFVSSMTLFAETAEDNALFVAALRKFNRGERDPLTVEGLRS